jgi:hypothetical protein
MGTTHEGTVVERPGSGARTVESPWRATGCSGPTPAHRQLPFVLQCQGSTGRL